MGKITVVVQKSDAGSGISKLVPDIELELVDSKGQSSFAKSDAAGEATFAGLDAGRYIVKAPHDRDDSNYTELLFAFSDAVDVRYGPQLERWVRLPDAGSECKFPLLVWDLAPTPVGADDSLDRQFSTDVFQLAFKLYDDLVRKGASTQDAWDESGNFVKRSFGIQSGIEVFLLCSVCRSRYYTPGTPYYMNVTAYQTCMYSPRCT